PSTLAPLGQSHGADGDERGGGERDERDQLTRAHARQGSFRGRMRGAFLAGALLLAAVFAAPASAAGVQAWDGSNPFTCAMQNGLAVQNPNADPLCIEYDHAGSTATDAESQLTTLVTEGPNQLSATVNKCAMYQVDHFTGPLYEFDSAIFFNKAT